MLSEEVKDCKGTEEEGRSTMEERKERTEIGINAEVDAGSFKASSSGRWDDVGEVGSGHVEGKGDERGRSRWLLKRERARVGLNLSSFEKDEESRKQQARLPVAEVRSESSRERRDCELVRRHLRRRPSMLRSRRRTG